MRNKKALIILVVSLLSPLTCSASDELIIDVTEWWKALEGVTGNGFVRDDNTNTISLNSDNDEFTSDVAKWWEDAGPIRIENNSERNITIDGEIFLEGESLKLKLTKGLLISGNNITLKNISVSNFDPDPNVASVIDEYHRACVFIDGNNVELDNVKVHNCYSHGILIDGENNNALDATIKNSVVTRTNLIALTYMADIMAGNNTPDNGTNPVGSAIKMSRALGSEILNNLVINNYGEGINATRSKESSNRKITISGNVTVDNLNANIYSDNSQDVTIDSNYSYCTYPDVFRVDQLTGGRVKDELTIGIAVAEEWYYDDGDQPSENIDDGAQPSENIEITNNIVSGCFNGITYNANNGMPTRDDYVNRFLGFKDSEISDNTVFNNFRNAVYFKAVDNRVLDLIPPVTVEMGKVSVVNNIFGVQHDYRNTFFHFPCAEASHLIHLTDPTQLNGADGCCYRTDYNLWVNGTLDGNYTYNRNTEKQIFETGKVSGFSTRTYSFDDEADAAGKGSSLSDPPSSGKINNAFDSKMISLLNKLPLEVACYIYNRDPSDPLVSYINNETEHNLDQTICSDVTEFPLGQSMGSDSIDF